MAEKIKVYGYGNLWNPETNKIFVKFRDGEALVTKEEVDIIKKYHKQVQFSGQKPKPKPKPKPQMKVNTKAKALKDVNTKSFKIPEK